MGPLLMVIGDEFLDDMSQVFLAQHDEVVKALLAKGLCESLRVSILIWSPNGSAFQLDIIRLQSGLKLLCELGVLSLRGELDIVPALSRHVQACFLLDTSMQLADSYVFREFVEPFIVEY